MSSLVVSGHKQFQRDDGTCPEAREPALLRTPRMHVQNSKNARSGVLGAFRSSDVGTARGRERPAYPAEEALSLLRQRLVGEAAAGVCKALGPRVEELAGELLVHEGAVFPASTVPTQVELAHVALACLRCVVGERALGPLECTRKEGDTSNKECC